MEVLMDRHNKLAKIKYTYKWLVIATVYPYLRTKFPCDLY